MRGGRQFSGTDPGKIANSQILIITKKGAEVEYFANFLILAKLAAFLDHTKENADVSKNDGYF